MICGLSLAACHICLSRFLHHFYSRSSTQLTFPFVIFAQSKIFPGHTFFYCSKVRHNTLYHHSLSGAVSHLKKVFFLNLRRIDFSIFCVSLLFLASFISKFRVFRQRVRERERASVSRKIILQDTHRKRKNKLELASKEACCDGLKV